MSRRLGAVRGWGPLLAVAIVAAWSPVPAAGQQARPNPSEADGLVKQALYYEIYGSQEDRQRLLAAALHSDPELAPARWHTGHVRFRNRWVAIDELPDLIQNDRRLIAYRNARARQPDTVAGHLALARWCADRGMAAQQRAHLERVLLWEPDNAEARRQLGHRLVAGEWLSSEQQADLAAQSDRVARDLAKWLPRLERIRAGLLGRGPASRERAAAELRAIGDPAAIAAMELTFSTASEEAALLMVETFSQMRHADAAAALARQAVFSPWDFVRSTAADNLRGRPLETFVPMLLASMYTQAESQTTLMPGPGGRLVHRHAFYREGQQARQLMVLDTAYQRWALPGGNRAESLARALGDAAATTQLREWQRVMQNVQTEALNERIGAALARAVEQVLPPDPRQWWQWWDEYNETVYPDEKPTQQQYALREVTVIDAVSSLNGDGGSGSLSGGPRVGYECLAAGTLVWTLDGARRIESLHVGDLVLAQHPTTGELTYKPVLRTTQRPAGPVFVIELEGETIQASGGHLFWVSGQGWTKARDLKSGAELHTVDGTRRVSLVSQAEPKRTYNLIVADFHTYFCGQGQLLCHDVTNRRPTPAIVPGLVLD